jgi:hypothetical protein
MSNTHIFNGRHVVVIIGLGNGAIWMKIRGVIKRYVSRVIDSFITSCPGKMVEDYVEHEVHATRMYRLGERQELALSSKGWVQRIEVGLPISMV